MATFRTTDIAFVTGGGSGIGRATCQVLAEQGATVVAADINKEAADQTVSSLTGRNHYSVKVDVTDQASVKAAVDDVISKYSSPPTIAVNCAGLMLVEAVLSTTEESYNRTFDVNLKGTVWVTQAVCQKLVDAKMKGVIVSISSIAKYGYRMLAIYGATKAAVEAFSSSVAKEFGPLGIRANVVCPGYTETPMMEPFPEEGKKIYTDKNPLGRAAKPREIAETIAFLASEKSSYVNGASISVDGGIE